LLSPLVNAVYRLGNYLTYGGCKDAQSFLAALAPAVTDADARERFLADPKAVLAAAGLDLPEWFMVSVREGDAAELIITVPGILDPDADLSEDVLDGVVGGRFGVSLTWAHC
jgi:nucleotide-binding universal stress UspA family protein